MIIGITGESAVMVPIPLASKVSRLVAVTSMMAIWRALTAISFISEW